MDRLSKRSATTTKTAKSLRVETAWKNLLLWDVQLSRIIRRSAVSSEMLLKINSEWGMCATPRPGSENGRLPGT